jgi:hypothetical protein
MAAGWDIKGWEVLGDRVGAVIARSLGAFPFPQQPGPVNVGKQVVIEAPLLVGETNVQPVLQSAVCGFTQGRTVTVALTESDEDYLPSSGDSELLFGSLQWRIGQGYLQTAEFDLKTGATVFTIAADFWEVRISYGDVGAGPRRFQCSASIATSPSNLRLPTRTDRHPALPVGVNGPFLIPRHAVAFKLSNFATGGSITMRTLDSKGITQSIMEDDGSILSSQSNVQVLPGGARQYELEVVGAATAAAVIWELAF